MSVKQNDQRPEKQYSNDSLRLFYFVMFVLFCHCHLLEGKIVYKNIVFSCFTSCHKRGPNFESCERREKKFDFSDIENKF